MATSGTATYNLELIDLIEEAFERCGVEVRAGHQVRTARRSLNLLLAEWANRGINLWTIDQLDIPLLDGQETYVLPPDTVDVFEVAVRTGTGTSQSDLMLNRISTSVYTTIPNKLSPGRPYQMLVKRAAAGPSLILWPVPNSDTLYTMIVWRLRRLEDAGTGLTTQDIPFRFLNALTAGLAYQLSMKIPEALPRVAALKAQYDEAWMLAADEDREKAPVRLVPRMYR
jgi:hypothetical protein